MTGQIKILFFAQLREDLNCAELMLDAKGLATLADVKIALQALRPHWQEILQRPNLLAAINQEYAKVDAPVRAGDEVAFFPPVTGG